MNSSTSIPSILVDTNIVSGLAKGDLPASELEAVGQLLGLVATGDVTVTGTTVMRDELDQIPMPARAPHDAVYNTLRVLKTCSGVTWLDPATSQVVENPTYTDLRAILPDEPDARMIAIGVEHSQDYFMTHDRKSVLNRRADVEAICPIKPRLPTEIVAELAQRSA